jgi:DUF1680 family protein
MIKRQYFFEVPISTIRPAGWIRAYLERQRDGLTGHLEEAGFPFNDPTCAWAPTEGTKQCEDNWCPYEQRGYWVDGMVRCGALLDDQWLLKKGTDICDYILDHPDDDGYLGPKFLKDSVRYPRYSRWCHAVVFRALMAYAGTSKRTDIAEKLANHYFSETCDHVDFREVCNIETMLWAYGQTGEERLLKYAEKAWKVYEKQKNIPVSTEQMLSSENIHCHGVTYNEIAKQPAIIGMYNGDSKLIDASIGAYTMLERDHMLVDGVHSSSEFLDGQDPLASHETCDIADYTWSLGYLLMATENVHYADLIERAVYNAAPGAVTPDFKALQYFSCPNQIIADKHSNHNKFFKGGAWMSYRPNPGTECCPGDVNRIMPNFASRMWMRHKSGDVVTTLYGPSVYKGITEAGIAFTITEDTTYPFSSEISFSINLNKPSSFGILLRIPEWCSNAKIIVAGEEYKESVKAGTFARLNKEWQDGDSVVLELPMKFKLINCPRGGVALERGPLLYSLKIDEKWEIDKDEPKSSQTFPAWNLFPQSPWNYALDLDADNLEKQIKMTTLPVSKQPWTIETAPHILSVPARIVEGWKEYCPTTITKSEYQGNMAIADLTEDGSLEGDFRFTHKLPYKSDLKKMLKKKSQYNNGAIWMYKSPYDNLSKCKECIINYRMDLQICH